MQFNFISYYFIAPLFCMLFAFLFIIQIILSPPRKTGNNSIFYFAIMFGSGVNSVLFCLHVWDFAFMLGSGVKGLCFYRCSLSVIIWLGYFFRFIPINFFTHKIQFTALPTKFYIILYSSIHRYLQLLFSCSCIIF